MLKIAPCTSPHPQNTQHPQASSDESAGFAAILADLSTSKDERPNTRDELLSIVSMTPAERIRHQLLHGMGLTEEALRNLPVEERIRIEQRIQEEIERQLAGNTLG
ncbi:hypothetical protein [Marinobacterium marinum]|uniref:Uncharacterized protein n=1 Tax=Marinobacterium marinum TaxID=2756129 RepID=A0A7W1WY69_9GAMM|nr:hypothetical protein [Marinobacterium marinum]MBA4502222.1 hypothetical protein [Marinobacterium marinum]